MFKLKKSCWNCALSIGHRQEAIPQTYWTPGEPAMVEDCKSQTATDNWDNWTEEFNNSDTKLEYEEFFADKCPDYVSEKCTCEKCNKEIEIVNAITLNNMHDFSYTCSEKCATIVHEQIQKEIEESLEE
jgi:hypothetical protein